MVVQHAAVATSWLEGVVELNTEPSRTHPAATAKSGINHFTVVCLVSSPLNESEAGADFVLMETPRLFLCKIVLISIITKAKRFLSKQGQH